MNIEELSKLTFEYGGEWGIQHAKRLIALIEELGAGMDYDHEIIEIAAYLHDWGGYGPWASPGVEHHIRSCEVVLPLMKEKGFSQPMIDHVIECIRCHHGGPADRTLESKLFTDADALDIIGVFGTIKVFSMCPRDLRMGFERAKHWRDTSMAAITFPQTAVLAEERVRETNQLLAQFTQESMGMF